MESSWVFVLDGVTLARNSYTPVLVWQNTSIMWNILLNENSNTLHYCFVTPQWKCWYTKYIRFYSFMASSVLFLASDVHLHLPSLTLGRELATSSIFSILLWNTRFVTSSSKWFLLYVKCYVLCLNIFESNTCLIPFYIFVSSSDT